MPSAWLLESWSWPSIVLTWTGSFTLCRFVSLDSGQSWPCAFNSILSCALTTQHFGMLVAYRSRACCIGHGSKQSVLARGQLNSTNSFLVLCNVMMLHVQSHSLFLSCYQIIIARHVRRAPNHLQSADSSSDRHKPVRHGHM